MRNHNRLYYIFLWDSQNNKLPLKKAKEMLDALKRRIKPPKKHKP